MVIEDSCPCFRVNGQVVLSYWQLKNLSALTSELLFSYLLLTFVSQMKNQQAEL